jgi:hypothetical protein
VWLEEQGDQTRVMSDDYQIDQAELQMTGVHPIGRLHLTLGRGIAAAWLIWTTALIVMAVQVYPQAASLDADGFRATAWLAAWMLLTGGVIIPGRISRVVLLIAGGLAGVVAIGLGLV